MFYFLLKKTMKNISSTNNDGETVINLDKMSKSNKKNIEFKELLSHICSVENLIHKNIIIFYRFECVHQF